MHSDLIAVQEALAGGEPRFALLEVSGDRARVAPVLAPARLFAALSGRFDEAWSLGYAVEHAAPFVVRCRLEFLGRSREGLGQAPGLADARDLALTDAARAWEVLPARFPTETAWVEYDPEEGPNVAELGGDEAAPAAPALPPEPPRDPQMEKAKKHIDDLMDQLRGRGLGGPANRIIVMHGGYGKDVDESRRIYAELKGLLKG